MVETTSMPLIDLPAAVAMARRPFRWSQGDLAAACGVPVSKVSDVERGKSDPHVSFVVDMAAAMQLKPSKLLAMAEDAAEKRAALETETEMALDKMEAGAAATEARAKAGGPDR